MTGIESLHHYDRIDYSASADTRVSGTRTISPIGAIIHSTGGTDSTQWLRGSSADAGTPASANCLIDKRGRQVTLCPNDRFPYHAGRSRLRLDRLYTGDEISQLLIGIELEYTDDECPTWEQYDSCADVILWYGRRYMWRWPFVLYGHYGVAVPLGRRSDPVRFDWGALMGCLYLRSSAMRLPGLES